MRKRQLSWFGAMLCEYWRAITFERGVASELDIYIVSGRWAPREPGLQRVMAAGRRSGKSVAMKLARDAHAALGKP